jgi:cell division protein WhiA
MSFASETKNELVSLILSDCCAKAELSALTHMNGVITISSDGLRIEFQTQNATIARRYIKIVRQLYEVTVDVLTRKQMRLNKGNVYIVRITRYAKMIVNDLQLMSDRGFVLNIPEEIVQDTCCKRSYLRGAFLAGGSVSNPEKSSYHLEIFVLDEELAMDLRDLMNTFDLNARTISRRKGYIVYLKESEKISDFLRVIQANNAVLDFEDIRIYRDMNNSVNRIRNCEVANLNKSWDAANSQLDNINLIADTIGLDLLPPKLIEAALLRIKNPDSTLLELAEFYEEDYNQSISKSGLNHRYRKINEIAERIKNNETVDELVGK